MKIEGKITNIISNAFFVEADKKQYKCSSKGKFKTEEIKPVVGDNVIIEDETNTILEVKNRHTYIKRPKIANVSQIVLVVSIKKPAIDLLMLDKQLAYSEFLNIKPVILINKIDLDEEKAAQIENIYLKVGYKVIKTNAKDKLNIDELKRALANETSVFSGNSGVGKSTLINAIFEQDKTLEGEISKNNRGKNTTTSVKLYEIEPNTYIADTPGFSNFDVYEIPYKELYKYFKEFKLSSDRCEYSNCTHIKEKACGIKKALQNGLISETRYSNYKKIYDELKEREEYKW